MAATEGFIAYDEGEKKPLMVYVTAPATLPAGYTFEALLNDDPDRAFTCEVVGSMNRSYLFSPQAINDFKPVIESFVLQHLTSIFSVLSLKVVSRKVKPS
jgi:hypothetical protein